MASQGAEQRKQQVLSDLATARMGILDIARRLPVSKQRKVFLGIWSPRHLIAHLVGWDATNLKASGELLASKLPSFYKHHDPNWAAYNAKLVARHNRGSFKSLVAAAESSHWRLLARLERVPASEITRDRSIRFRGWKVTIERLLAAEASDERTHLKQLRRFVGVR
jgi:hypothetical protein